MEWRSIAELKKLVGLDYVPYNPVPPLRRLHLGVTHYPHVINGRLEAVPLCNDSHVFFGLLGVRRVGRSSWTYEFERVTCKHCRRIYLTTGEETVSGRNRALRVA